MKPTAIIQARMGSTRLPGKVLAPVLGRPMLSFVMERVRLAPSVAQVVVATSDTPEDEPIRQFCRQNNVPVFGGSLSDVLDRYYRASLRFPADPVLRITADCPLVDPKLIERLLQMYMSGSYDYVAIAAGAGARSVPGGHFPDGLDCECFSFGVLERAWREAHDPRDREHVTPYAWRQKNIFRCGMLTSECDYGHLRLTVDYPQDLQVITAIYSELYNPARPFSFEDVIAFLAEHPEIVKQNQPLIGAHRRHSSASQDYADARNSDSL
ncbi:MAG: cytidylyltransferase domain-containing protein [Terriglobales bacterium]